MIWTCETSPWSGSRNAWARINNVNGASRLSTFWNFFGTTQMNSCRDWWPWTKAGYITMTQRQGNNQWSGGIGAHPPPPKIECKNPLKKFSPQFFGIKILLISAGAIDAYFEGKTPREAHQACLVLARQCPASPGTCNPEETAYLGFQYLDNPHFSPDLAPSDYHLFPGLKKQLNGRHFSSYAEVVAAAETWLDGQLSEFFWVACKS